VTKTLVGPERWVEYSRTGKSATATYSCLPTIKPGQSWQSYVHEFSHYVYLLLPAALTGQRNYEVHSPIQAALELELAELVAGWLRDDAAGVKQIFSRLVLARPPDLRHS
jgi:hypothetical protein